MAKVSYIPPHDIRDRLLALKPYRDELCRLSAHFRFSSPEYRRLSDATLALDEAVGLLTGEPELLHMPMTPSRHGR